MKIKNRTNDKCKCVYRIDGTLLGLCMRCAYFGFEGGRKEWRRIVKVLKKLYLQRGKPSWFFNEDDLNKLNKGEI